MNSFCAPESRQAAARPKVFGKEQPKAACALAGFYIVFT